MKTPSTYSLGFFIGFIFFYYFRPFLLFATLFDVFSVFSVCVSSKEGPQKRKKVYNRLFFFVPYLERACLRGGTPCKSRTPRIVRYFTPGKSLTRPPRTRTMAYS